MQLFDLCCFQDVHPWSVRTNQSFCLTALGKGWPLQWLGCPQQRCDVLFWSELGKAQKGTMQHWQTADWTCFIPSSRASLYTKRKQTFCHLRLCWLCTFWHVCFDSPKVEDGSALASSQQHLLLSVLFNAIWILEITSSWKKALKSSPAHLWKTCVDFPLEGCLMQKCLEELSPWIHWENSEFGLVCKGIPGGLCLPAPFSCWQSLTPLLCN